MILSKPWRKTTIEAVENGFTVTGWNGTEEVVSIFEDLTDALQFLRQHYKVE